MNIKYYVKNAFKFIVNLNLKKNQTNIIRIWFKRNRNLYKLKKTTTILKSTIIGMTRMNLQPMIKKLTS